MVSKDNHTLIFSTKEGMVALDSPVKLRILNFIHNQQRSFDEIVCETCKAKSTVSVHLKDLIRQNILVEHRDTIDRRKKYFTVNSQFIAYSQRPVQENYDLIIDKLIKTVDSEEEFYKTLCHTVRYGLEAYGLNPKPVLKKIGKDIGKKMGVLFSSGNIEALLHEICLFWGKHKLGLMEVQDLDPLNITVHDCFDCSDMPDVERTLCAMDEGLLEGIIELRLGCGICVDEVECFGTGHDHCRFTIQVFE